jgi:Lipocalin-like domain
MNAVGAGLLVVIFAWSGFSQTRAPDREKLIGAWQLVSLTAPRPDGKRMSTSHPAGMLTYTRDGHVSVQLMYPASESATSNEYVLNGYEASFGSYEVNEAKHIVTHHIQGANTREGVGRTQGHEFGRPARRYYLAHIRREGALFSANFERN